MHCLQCTEGAYRGDSGRVQHSRFAIGAGYFVAFRTASAVAWSAGKNISIASSASVTSTGVPKTVVALIKESRPSDGSVETKEGRSHYRAGD